MKRLAVSLVSFLVLAAVFGSGGCSGADDITGPGGDRGITPPPFNVTPHPRPTPNPCRQNPADCD